MRMIRFKMLGLAALAIAASACSTESESDSFTHLTALNSRQLAVHRHNGPDAIVSVTGELSIDGKSVDLSPAQKELTTRYFAGAKTLRDDGFATGMAGASTALTAISSVVTGLASGEPDKIGAAVEAKAAKVEAQVEKVCRDLGELAATQDALVAAVPEFKPYALIRDSEVDECRRG
jgi:hypothetical protein